MADNIPTKHGHRFQDLTGKKFRHLTVIEYAGVHQPTKASLWKCQCDCGKIAFVHSGALRSGNTGSCGCRKSRTPTTHGMTKTPEYACWVAMIQRCTNPKAVGYHNYGGRGISVCERWMKFENFLADMKRRPSPDHELDSIDNDGNYEPGNCRWATHQEQAINRRTSRLITFNGKTQTAIEWARELGIKKPTFLKRIYSGWSIERILTTPVNPKFRNGKAREAAQQS